MSDSKMLIKPRLSIVVASQNALKSVSECLREIDNQRKQYNIDIVEIIIIDNSTDGTGEVISSDFSHLKLKRAPPHKLIPQLWGTGVSESNGEIIALVTTHFVPAKDWIAQILAIHKSSYDAVGGAIENNEKSGIISWAIYFCRYSPFMLPFPQHNTENFAADNGSYRRRALEQIDFTSIDGFWEVFIHQAMRKNNMRLVISPEIVVFHHQSFTFWGFIRQRYQHGRHFGQSRARSLSILGRSILIILSPLIPAVYIYRISRQVFSKKRNLVKYLTALPVLLLFLVSWSFGELCGYFKKMN